MDKISRRILADNIGRMIEKSRGSVRGWALSNKLDPRQIDRLTKREFATTVDTLDEIAEAIGVQPWQLLVPNMNPDSPPLLVMSKTERELFQRIQSIVNSAKSE